MDVHAIIATKRDGGALSDAEIEAFISGYVAGDITEYHASALLMAIYIHGMQSEELTAWTRAMLHSGRTYSFEGLGKPAVDKHSTGGVGDKVSIPLAPAVAACGLAVPMVSGRGLGHTGGTLDKLEAIPGMTTSLDEARFEAVLREHGFVFGGQTEDLVPADRKLYALRDATGLVASVPLIASSIMSKKLAEGIDALVLDVKYGSGAFLPDPNDGRELFIDTPAGGDELELSVTARNVGDGTLYQLIGTVEARGPAGILQRQAVRDAESGNWFPPVQLPFGKLEPGESATVILPVTIPRAVTPGPLDVVVTWSEYNDNAPEDIEAQLPPVRGLEAPNIVFDPRFSANGNPRVDVATLVAGQQAEVNATVTLLSGGDEPVELILSLTTDTPNAVEILTPESRIRPEPGVSPIGLGPAKFRLIEAVPGASVRVRLIDADFGEPWGEAFPVGGAQGGR